MKLNEERDPVTNQLRIHTSTLTYETFKGEDRYWYWHVKNRRNHRRQATGGEGFESRRNAERAMRTVIKGSQVV